MPPEADVSGGLASRHRLGYIPITGFQKTTMRFENFAQAVFNALALAQTRGQGFRLPTLSLLRLLP